MPETELFCGFTLGKTLQFYKGDGITIMSRKAVRHRTKTVSKFFNGLRPLLLEI